MSRSIGDFDLNPAVMSQPDLYEYPIQRWDGMCIKDLETDCLCSEESSSNLDIGSEETSLSHKELFSVRPKPFSMSIHQFIHPSLVPCLNEWLKPPAPGRTRQHRCVLLVGNVIKTNPCIIFQISFTTSLLWPG
jgi:hypothetical protein